MTRSKSNTDAFATKKQMNGKSTTSVPLYDDEIHGENATGRGLELEEDENKKYDDTGDAIDDPVRMYLMQMGEIPLLTRDQEVESAKEIERTRFRFRNSMLATDFMLRGAIDALQKVHDKKLRLDRTIEVSVTNTTEKRNIMRRSLPSRLRRATAGDAETDQNSASRPH